MPSPIDDDLLLNRYVDGELGHDEQAALEQRLRVDGNLRSELADLVTLNASLDIGLAGLRFERGSATNPNSAGLPSSGDGAGRGAAMTTMMRCSRWVGSHRAGVAAALLCLAAGAGTWLGFRSWPSPASIHTSPASDPYAVLAQLDEELDKSAIRADVGEILNPATSHARRLDIYRNWRGPESRALEPLVWALAPHERDPRARAALYSVIPARSIRSHDLLLIAAQREWGAYALEPLSPLLDRLLPHPDKPSEQLFAEILNARPELWSAWFGERLPTIQAAFPNSPTICAGLTRALGDQDQLVRAWAALARAAIGQRDGVDCAKTLLHSSSADVRLLAITTIRRHGMDADLTPLTSLLSDTDPSIRKAAQEALEGRNLPLPVSTSNP